MPRVQRDESRRGAAAAALLCAALVACAQDASPAGPGGASGPGPPGDRVLFVGNSLTEANDLPLMVEALSAAAGRPLSTESVTYGGVSLEDHWALGTQRSIERGGWRFVVLQQGPSALPDSRVNLREWTRRFDAVIRAAGAVTALYMVWPDSRRDGDFPRVSESYRLAAQDVAGILLPAGDAWQAAWRRQVSIALYGPDGFHPSAAGSYLAALTIACGLTESSPVGLPHRLRLRNGVSIEVAPAAAPALQAAADEALSGT
ncbi:MAG TPA: hypothetical protein VFM88_07075 [Vicinamibacteria bacterium]|nr:hypothetical protein [Vicinamibacteria bacterium]